MRGETAIATRSSRIALLISFAVGWAMIGAGLATGSGLLGSLGAIVVGLGNLIFAKAFLELRSSSIALAGAVRRNERRNERRFAATETDIERLASQARELTDAIAANKQAIQTVRDESSALERRFERRMAEVERTHSSDRSSHTKTVDDLRSEVRALESAHDVTRLALSATRSMTDKLAVRGRRAFLDDGRLQAVGRNNVASPLLSIAIPSYNRPSELSGLLESIAQEIEGCEPGLVELCITDDASPDPETLEAALEFVEGHRFASLHVQPTNIGLERNVMAASKPCRGEYLWLVGNDDQIVPGSLQTVLDDLRESQAPVLLYSKHRMRLDGSPAADVAGSIPIDLPAGGHHLFETLLDAADRQGLLSTFGFAGPVVLRRDPFAVVDPTPYLDLTMYTRTCVMIEAFAGEPVAYRNTAVVVHRTPTRAEKNAEALSRPEEEFMSGGLTRLSRYYGTTLAASMQRLIDRGALDYGTVARMPENLMTDVSLVEWIVRNRSIDPEMDQRLGADVVADADRFLAGIRALSPPPEV